MIIVKDPDVISGFRYESPLESVPGISHCGEALCNARHTVGSHSHKYFEFTYLVHGEYSWQVGSRVHHLEPGDMFVAMPGQRHFTANMPHSEFHQFWIGLDVRNILESGRALAERIRRLEPQVIPHSQEAEGLLRGIIRQIVNREPQCEKVTLAYVATFLAFVEQRILLRDLPASARGAARYSYQTEKAIAFMRRNLTRRVPLGEMAVVAGCSVSKLCGTFSRETGLSPGAFHFKLRADAAREAILRPEASITEVAMEYGFSSSQHFSMAFKRAFRISPRDWRKAQLTPQT